MINKMGDKITAKETMIKAGVPVVPGGEGLLESVDAAKKLAKEIVYPVIIKATAGGGGKGMRVVEKEEDFEDKKFIVRKSFLPREGYAFLFIDFQAQEFRVALDYAGEHELIRRINEGEDPHQSTADMVGITRKRAKCLNFSSIYGSGAGLIGEFLGISEYEAQELKNKYFSRMPKLKHFLYKSGEKAKQRGLVWNKYGRIYHLANRDDSYKIANNLIQGTCADICKFAMIKIDRLLQGKRSRMVVQVHDELVIELHLSELDLQEKIKKIMEDEYQPKNGMFLTCSVEHSKLSWGSCDKVKGYIQ
jgi:DNA polymerase I-like protein with 3'-5' exonuclease and polymerase domains